MDQNTREISITITPLQEVGYKSITTLSWDNIPGFAILTGRNGAGKTQLLELLAYHFSGAKPAWLGSSPLPVQIVVNGYQYKPEEIAYVPNSGRFSGASTISLANISQNARGVLQQSLQALQHNQSHDIAGVIKAKRIINRLGGRDISRLDEDDISQVISEIDAVVDDIDVSSGLASLFVAYRLRSLEAIERGTPGYDENGLSLGPAPWDLVNDALKFASFPYQINSPVNTRITSSYTVMLVDMISNRQIAPRDLSSGEQVLLQLILWLYTAGKVGTFPKLLILDEPDAHLHPSMTTQFLDVISEVLVDRYGVRVIMTTHSPSTVALAPENSVFQIERGATSVERVGQRADIISLLTAGLVTVSRATKFCFVEDEDDVAFYEGIYEILMDHGPSRDPHALQPAPSIAFIPTCVGAGQSKISGGCTIVKRWVQKLDTDPLDRMFLGIIDRDNRNVASDRLYVLARYSFENYLLDPMVVFALLIEEGIAPPVSDLTIKSGDEHLLRLEKEDILQNIANVIRAKMEAADQSLVTVSEVWVEYTRGQKIKVPDWLIDRRGHDLLSIAQQAFARPRIINPPRLIKAMRRCRLIPVDLAQLLRQVQEPALLGAGASAN